MRSATRGDRMEDERERQAEADARAESWWTADMPDDLRESWQQLHGNAMQFLVTTPLLVAFAYGLGRSVTKTPAAGSPFYSFALSAFAASLGVVVAAEVLRRRLLPGPGVPGEVAGLRERRASAAYAKATFAGLIAAQLPGFAGFLLVFMGLPFAYYLAFVAVSAVEIAVAFPTRRRWERIMRTALAPA